MSGMDDFFFRAFFKLKVHESHGTAFQHLINTLFSYGVKGFQSIAPWGNWGDGGNDGWVEVEEHQVVLLCLQRPLRWGAR